MNCIFYKFSFKLAIKQKINKYLYYKNYLEYKKGQLSAQIQYILKFNFYLLF